MALKWTNHFLNQFVAYTHNPFYNFHCHTCQLDACTMCVTYTTHQSCHWTTIKKKAKRTYLTCDIRFEFIHLVVICVPMLLTTQSCYEVCCMMLLLVTHCITGSLPGYLMTV